MSELYDLRQQIDNLDRKLLQLLARRFACCLKIRTFKHQIQDVNREADLKKLWQEEAAKLDIDLPFSQALLQLILQESKRLQQSA